MLSAIASDHYLTRYHHRGELPRLLPNGDPTRLARKYEDVSMTEENIKLKEKYKDLYIISPATVPPIKGISRCCTGCLECIKDSPM